MAITDHTQSEWKQDAEGNFSHPAVMIWSKDNMMPIWENVKEKAIEGAENSPKNVGLAQITFAFTRRDVVITVTHQNNVTTFACFDGDTFIFTDETVCLNYLKTFL